MKKSEEAMIECTFKPNLKPQKYTPKQLKTPPKNHSSKLRANPTIDQITPIDKKNISDTSFTED